MNVLEQKKPGIKSWNDGQIEDLYKKLFPAVASFIKKRNGTFEEARDIFQDALVISFENDRPIDTSEEGYIMGIVKNLWNRKLRSAEAYVQWSDSGYDRLDESLNETVNDTRLLNFLQRAGRKCLDLLHACYFSNLNRHKIASDLGYSNEHSLSVQKYKCLEKIRNSIRTKSLQYDDFLQ